MRPDHYEALKDWCEQRCNNSKVHTIRRRCHLTAHPEVQLDTDEVVFCSGCPYSRVVFNG